jgi:hypothetical protein
MQKVTRAQIEALTCYLSVGTPENVSQYSQSVDQV